MKIKSVYIADDNSEWDCEEHAIARDEYIKLSTALTAAENAITTRRLMCNHPVAYQTYHYVEHDPLCADEEYYTMSCMICEYKWTEDVKNRQITSERKIIKR